MSIKENVFYKSFSNSLYKLFFSCDSKVAKFMQVVISTFSHINIVNLGMNSMRSGGGVYNYIIFIFDIKEETPIIKGYYPLSNF